MSTTPATWRDQLSPKGSTSLPAYCENLPAGLEFPRAALRLAVLLQFQSGRTAVCIHTEMRQPTTEEAANVILQAVDHGRRLDGDAEPRLPHQFGCERTIHYTHKVAILGSEDVPDDDAALREALERMQIDDETVPA